ncbi:MAG: hypothetical protein OXI74_01720 [Rhodospirillaceae bacterium]|nr:hypothetical protein [Rhodospirillaceae bacterium]
MNATRDPDSPRSAVRGAQWVLGAPALALAATFMLVAAGAPGDWIGAVWLVALLLTIAASFTQALLACVRHGDWSAFACAHPPCTALRRDDRDFDFATRTGLYAHLRVRDEHESLTREGDRDLGDHDLAGSLG